jgi:hypothetical protein
VLEEDETCDGSDFGGLTCGDVSSYEAGRLTCTAECKLDLSRCHTCGNGQVEGAEVCDGDYLAAQTCLTQGYYSGTLACSADCLSFDFSDCVGTCGDDNIDVTENFWEVCDGEALAGQTCESMGFDGGQLTCLADCSDFDTTECFSVDCGNGVQDEGEVCDGDDLGGETCETLGLVSGTLGCRPDCTDFDISDCVAAGMCGNNFTEGVEACDGDDLDGATCQTLQFYTGQLACLPDCTYDVSGCAGYCGDGVVQSVEVCDSTNVGAETCETQGFGGGTLACLPDCANFDTTNCISAVCGNGSVEAGEVCDGDDLDGQTCGSLGFDSGTLACLSDCAEYDTSNCGSCGDGALNGTEECDGLNLGGATCADFDCWNGGGLSCDTDCTLDISGCQAGHDEDGDGVDDNCDNCPSCANANQTNSDTDMLGDACQASALLSSIEVFDPMLNDESSWTAASGTWSYGGDEVSGGAQPYGGNYLHAFQLSDHPYAVEATFYYDQGAPSDSNWTGLLFAWEAPDYAYACHFERDSQVLGLWNIAGGGAWNQLESTIVNTSAGLDERRKVRVFYDGNMVNCRYEDETGSTETVTISGSQVNTDMSGQAGIRVYNENTVFTSFVIYE